MQRTHEPFSSETPFLSLPSLQHSPSQPSIQVKSPPVYIIVRLNQSWSPHFLHACSKSETSPKHSCNTHTPSNREMVYGSGPEPKSMKQESMIATRSASRRNSDPPLPDAGCNTEEQAHGDMSTIPQMCLIQPGRQRPVQTREEKHPGHNMNFNVQPLQSDEVLDSTAKVKLSEKTACHTKTIGRSSRASPSRPRWRLPGVNR